VCGSLGNKDQLAWEESFGTYGMQLSRPGVEGVVTTVVRLSELFMHLHWGAGYPHDPALKLSAACDPSEAKVG